MLIGLGIAILAILFGGGGNDLLFSQFDKYVKKVVEDKEKKELIVSEIKEVKSLQKGYLKQTKKFVKEMNKLVHEQSTTKEQFDTFYTTVKDFEIETNNEFVPHRINVQNALTQNEWDEILDRAKKNIAKTEKSSAKSLKSLKKSLDKMEVQILEHVGEDHKVKVTESLKKFTQDFYDTSISVLSYTELDHKVLSSKTASREEIDGLLNDYADSWMKLLGIFADLHNELAEIVPEDEWKPVAKQLINAY